VTTRQVIPRTTRAGSLSHEAQPPGKGSRHAVGIGWLETIHEAGDANAIRQRRRPYFSVMLSSDRITTVDYGRGLSTWRGNIVAINVAIFSLLTVWGSTAWSAQQLRAQPLPRSEIFTPRSGLRVSLRAASPSARIGESLALTLRFENVGTERLYIVPRQPHPVFAARVEPVAAEAEPAGAELEGRRIPVVITSDKLIALLPGRTWDMPLQAPARLSPIRLFPGEYTASLTYINAPDYDYVHYDPDAMPEGIWEGAVAVEAIRLSVLPPSEQAMARYLQVLKADRLADDLSLELLALSGPNGVSALIEQLAQAGQAGPRILTALLRAERLPIPELVNAIERLPPRERQSLITSHDFSWLLQRHATCEALLYLVARLDDVTAVFYQFQRLFTPHAGSCPAAGALLRQTVLDPKRTSLARATAAALLGAFPDRITTELLLDILERRIAVPQERGLGDPIRAAAASALGLIGGQQVIAALARALPAEPLHSATARRIVDALFAIKGPDVVPALSAALSSPDSSVVTRAVQWLAALNAKTALPAIIGLLGHPDPTIRSSASDVLRRWSEATARDAMIAARSDVNEYVRFSALYYLGEHGDRTMIDWFVSALESRHHFTREAAVLGIRRFGTASDFVRIRRLFDLRDRPDVHGYLPWALGSLTFTPNDHRRGPADWDNWYARHRTGTRVDWARESLRAAAPDARRWPFDPVPQREALEYLAASRDAWFRADFERAAESTSFAIRTEAARAIAGYDKQKAGRLLLREFAGRFHTGCQAANRALNELTGETRTVDCRVPQRRAEAAAAWAGVVNRR
jgi:HEAT repeat protein